MSSSSTTNDTTPTFSGISEANTPVSIYDNGTLIGTAVTNAAGAWTFTPTTALSQGDHLFTARATDASGNQSPLSSPFALRIDTSAPAAPSIVSVTDDVGTVQGPVANGGVTNDVLPTLRGTAEAGSIVTVFSDGTAIGTAITDSTGNWSFQTTTALTEGGHALSATATDAAGNVSPTSGLYNVVIDTIPPAAPVITSIYDDMAPNIGTVLNGGLSNDTTPTINGTSLANTTVLIYDGTTLLGSTTSNALGAWSFTPASAIGNGAHSFTAQAVDTAGNASASSNGYSLSIDSIAPTQGLTFTTLTTDTGTVGDWSTQDTSPTVSGTLSATLGAGEQVQVQVDGGSWVNVSTVGTTWFYGAGTLAVGSHTMVARVVDAAGNIGSSTSQTVAITAVPATQAPVVQANSSGLLGLVGLDALNLIDIGSQSVSAYDPNNNLKSVTVSYAAVVGLGAYTLTASNALASELGLSISIVNTGVLGILLPTSTLTITSLDSSVPIDNLAINELLNTVHLQQTPILGPILNASLLNAISISATDMTGLTTTSTGGTLLNANLLTAAGSPNLIEGGTGNDTLTGTSGNDRIYGHGGNDILNGGDGDDFLRGGPGADSLNGGNGNDTLVYDSADVRTDGGTQTIIDGGAGTDTLLIESGSPTVNLGTATNIRNIEVIDLGTGDTGRQAILTEAGVLRATDANHQLTILGDGKDTVTMTGAVFQGQTLIAGEAYNHYTLGTTNIFVDHPVMVVT